MTRSYPIHRKPPISHKVTSHIRDGHSVGGYTRGSGRTRTIPISRGKQNAEAFTVTMKYKDGSSEKVNVIAPKGDYKKALDEALEERTHEATPMEINILDPSLGEIIGFIRKGVGTGLKYVKKGIIRASPHVKSGIKRGVKGLGRGLGKGARSIAKSVQASRQNAEAKRLVNHSYSPDPSVRATARTKLKRKYPEVYDNCDFSTRETRSIISERKRAKITKEKKRAKQIKQIFG